jgi:hypothetical protein
MYTHEVITGISLKLTEEAIGFNSTSYRGTVQYWVESWFAIIYCSFCTLLRQLGRCHKIGRDILTSTHFKYKTTSFQVTMVKE